MSRYRGPRLRITRRLGDLPGLTRKAAKRSHPPGQHGQARRKRSEYAIRLEEKQKLRFNYGISERQLVRYVKKARAQEGSTGTNLLKLLENRLDNVCFRLGFENLMRVSRNDMVNKQYLKIILSSKIYLRPRVLPISFQTSFFYFKCITWWRIILFVIGRLMLMCLSYFLCNSIDIKCE